MKTLQPQSSTETNRRHVLVEFKVNELEATHTPAKSRANQIEEALSMHFDKTHDPITINPTDSQRAAMRKARQSNFHFIVKAEANENEIERIKRHSDVVDVWTDAQIELTSDNAWCPGDDSAAAVGVPRHFGTMDEILDQLGVEELWPGGASSITTIGRRERITVGVVDGGIYATGRIPVRPPRKTIDHVIGGWVQAGSVPWGTASYGINDHGNAMASLIQLVAPQSQLLDMRIFFGPDTPFPARISNAIQAYRWAIETYKYGYRDATQNLLPGTPQILSNSWCLFRRSWVEDDYARNMDHPFTRMVIEAIETGMIVLFCAGNCGASCTADSRCGTDVGPRKSIWGANAHPRVITVGAVTKLGKYVGYSSQGPAMVFYGNSRNRAFVPVNKPDFCCYTAFSGGYYTGSTTPNSGTSSATALTAGIIALLKQMRPEANHDSMKSALINTARVTWPSSSSIPNNIGAGVIQPMDALRALEIGRRAMRTPV